MVMSKCDQASKLVEIGAQLKQVRETKHIPLHQITSTTLISERHLIAIEEGNLELLPEPVYIQGFIRKYGKALGVPELAEEFPITTKEEQITPNSKPRTEFRSFHLYALYVVVVGVAVSILASVFNESRNSKVVQDDSKISKSAQLIKPKSENLPKGARFGQNGLKYLIPTSLATDSPSPTSPASSPDSDPTKPQSSLSTPTNPANSIKPVNLGISTTAEAWLSVSVDGKTQFEGTLPKGTSRNWAADKEITIRVGNGGAVSAVLNDKQIGALGQAGEVVEKKFNLTQEQGDNQAQPSRSDSLSSR
jgi:cytoskeleton protein RodZ